MWKPCFEMLEALGVLLVEQQREGEVEDHRGIVGIDGVSLVGRLDSSEALAEGAVGYGKIHPWIRVLGAKLDGILSDDQGFLQLADLIQAPREVGKDFDLIVGAKIVGRKSATIAGYGRGE